MGTIKDKIILLVDDEPAILQMCQSILKENGFENIVTANTALSALERMSAKPDMAVLDVMLPDMDGFMLAKTIREQNPIPILFLTAKGEIDDKSKGFEAGADDYMVKPFIAQEFVWRILHHQLLRKIILDIDRPLLVCKFLAHTLQGVAVIPEPAVRVCNDTILVFKDRSPIFFGHKPVLLSVVCLRGRADKRGRTAPCDNRKIGTNISTGFSRTGVSPYW